MESIEALYAKVMELRKAKDPVAKSLTLVISNMNQIAKDRATNKSDFEADNDDAIAAIRRSLKQIEDTITVLEANGGTKGALYEESVRERSILQELLPAGPNVGVINDVVAAYIESEGLEKSIKSMGKIMAMLNQKYGSLLDKGMASQVVRIILTEG